MSKVMGTEKFINQATGEIIETQTVLKYGDFDFHKIWLAHILDVIEETGNKKMQILMYFLKSMDSNNRVFATFDQIAKEVGCNRKTVGELVVSLEKADVLVRPARGQIRLSPRVIFKGSHSKRMNVLIQYKDESQLDLFDNSQNQNEEAA